MRRPSNARLLVVLDQPVAVYSGMVPGRVAGDYDDPALEIDVVPLARRAGVGVILAAATDVDPVRRALSIQGRPPLSYDLLSLDVGSTVRGLDLPGVRAHAISTRPIARFVAGIDARIDALTRLGRPARVAIVGGGAAGCEIAFTLDARLRHDALTARLTILCAENALFSGASPSARRRVEREAHARGIETRCGVRVTQVDAQGAVLEPRGDESGIQRFDADLVIWATGAAPNPFPAHAATSRLRTDARGFLEVRDTLQAVGFDDVFAAGDCAVPTEHSWIPRAGVYAVRQGPVLADNLRAWLEERPLRRYRPQRDFLALLNLGEGRALGSKWGFAFAGRAVHRLKDRIDRKFMRRFQVLDEAGRPNPDLIRLGAMDDDAPMSCGGCAAKLGPSPLSAALEALPTAPPDDSVLLGLEARDDVAATRLTGGGTLLHNVDVIRAFCDDPYLVARVAASNALSDLYAKGGRPRHAQAIVTLPELPARAARDRLVQILAGLRSILDPAQVTLLGGHTTLGEDVAVGLSITGDGPSEETLFERRTARPGDRLVLTKPLGTGVVLAADMQGRARGEWVAAAWRSMQHTHAAASRVLADAPIHAVTDVTGFGLAGHLLSLLGEEMCAQLDREAVPLLPGATTLWSDGVRSTAHPANAGAFAGLVQGVGAEEEAWLFDPQTAGGLLFAVAPGDHAAIVAALRAAGEAMIATIGEIDAGAGLGPGGARIGIRDSAPRR